MGLPFARGMRVLALLAGLSAAACGDDGVPSCPPPTNEGCGRDADCADDVCARTTASSDGAAATLRCAPASGEIARCTSPGDCARGLCLPSGRCVRACGTDADCPEGSSCASRWVRDGAGGHERATTCAPRTSVEPLARRVLAETTEPELPAAERGAHFVLAPRCGARPTTAALLAGDERVGGGPLSPGGPPPANPVFAAFPGPVAVVLPNNPTYDGWNRDHRLRFDAAASVERLIFPPAPAGATTLDLDVFVLGAPPLTDADLEPLRQMLASGGLDLGEVREHAVTGTLAERLGVLDGERGALPELEELFGLGAGLPPGTPVFLVRHIDGFLAITGGVPIPLGAPGSAAAGVAVGAEDAGGDLGLILAHELGHALGLFHLIEPDGSLREALPDTPVCPPAADADGDGRLSAEECSDQGASNLMFWSIDQAEPRLTPDQSAVVIGAPVLR